MAVTMAEITKLRKMTGAGMMDCKNALTEAEGDMDKAMEILRKKGQAVAAKRSDREAGEGCVLAKADGNYAAVLALKCETDFVAKNADFVALTREILDMVIANRCKSMEEILNLPYGNATVAQAITDRSGITGEKMELDGFNYVEAPVTSSYVHAGNRLAVVVGFNKELSIQRNVLIYQMQELSSKKNYNPFDILFKRTTRYPMAVRDGLEIADDLINIQNRKSRYYSFADELEKELLHGKVSISKDGEVLFASEKAKSTRIPIHLTASIVKTLASLTFYLRYWAKENDLIIIDEPELNLHPDSQIVLARIFARLLNNGFRLLISTHSDYIIRELNNLIMLSGVRSEIVQKARELGQYREDEYISASEVSAYLFNYQKRGKVVVKSIEVSDAGFEVATIDEAISRLNAVSEELYYMIKYGE